MSKWSIASAAVGVAVLLTTVSGQQTIRPNDYVDGEILVKFSPRTDAFRRNAILSSRGVFRIRRFDAVDIDYVRVPRGQAVAAAVGALQRMAGVDGVQPNYTRYAAPGAPPNDPFWLDGSLWGLLKIDARSVWTTYTAGNGTVVIANIDTGVDYTHPDLAPNMWRNPGEVEGNGVDDDGNGYVDDVFGIDTANRDSSPLDDQGHGTHTAGTIAAVGNNGIGVSGVNWNAKILACKFLNASGSGTDAGAIECFDYIVALRNRGVNIRVSSNSWGALRGSGPPAAALEAAIDTAGAAGIVNVFGAGNDGTNNDTAPFDPASYASPSIIAVASSNQTDRKSAFSNYGAATVDIAAPGEDIVSTYPGNSYVASSGTSMATPHVAGAAALLAAMDPTLTVPAIKSLLMDNVDQSSKWTGRVVSGGRLNVFRAASAVGGVTPNTPPVVTITAPAGGATFKAPAAITLAAEASDSDGSIQQVAFYANGAPIGVDTTSPFGIVWSNVAAGDYTITAIATDNLWLTAISAPVAVVVTPNTPPTVAITNPIGGAVFTSPATITIDATAADEDGSVTQVAFYANGLLIGTDATSPYSIAWSPATGSYSLNAVATDNQAATTTSTAVPITVNPIPNRVNVALSSNGGVASASSTLSASYPPSGANNGDRRGLNWGAGGGWNDGTQNTAPDWLEVNFAGPRLIEEVSVFSMQDNYSAPVEPTPSMTFSFFGLRGFEVQYWDGDGWTPVPNGVVANNSLVWRRFVFPPLTTSKIRVFITSALNGYSRVMEVEAWGVSAAGNAPPAVAISAPAPGTTFTVPASITIDAAATDTDGTVQRVDFYANGSLIGSDTQAPFSITWEGAEPGTVSLTAVATDDAGATTTSAAVQVAVTAGNAPPVIAIMTPAGGATFNAPATISIEAAASDVDGTIQMVTFYANGGAIGTDTTNPYTVAWPNVGAGTYTLTAVAVDSQNASTTSSPVVITVNTMPGRINVALASNGAVASASSVLGGNYPPSGAINGDRRGLNWGSGGGWNDGTPNASPDWLEVAFAGTKIIDEVNVFSMQDNYTSPVEPTPTMTFSLWGLRGFEVQYWTGSSWAGIPGAAVSNNNLVWRRFTFAPVTTSRIRVFITAALNSYSRMIEVEAWGVPDGGNTVPTVALTSPAPGASFAAPAAIAISADANDSDGTIASVDFFADGVPIGTATSAPFGMTWFGVGAGTYSLTAVATDNLGATASSAAVQVSVTSNMSPTVAITSPASGATFTAPATIAVAADATDDGGVSSVTFYANGAEIGTDTSSPFSLSWTNVTAGTYTLTAMATDSSGTSSMSAGVSITVNPGAVRLNVALAANGAVATASSSLGANYPVSATINGDRRGVGWGAGGGWNDGTANASPDWVEVAFSGPKTIDEVSVFSLQDNYSAPVEPTPTMTFTSWGLRGFRIQYWDGAAWVDIPGASTTTNNLVWKRFTFTPVTTTRIRVFITAALNGYSRMIEVEAWGVDASGPALTFLQRPGGGVNR